MLLGVSFLATPVKFLAPSLTLPAALDVGRQTFGIFSIVEVIVSLIVLTVAVLSGGRRRNVVLAVLVGSLVVAQFAWLLPVLDARVETILQGGTPEDSNLHNLYIAIDSAKLFMLSAICWYAQTVSPKRERDVAANAC
jgi:uncharacterized membrane protein YvlD (DUF360 family)